MRTAFLVDGFNLYHSAKEAQRALARPRGAGKGPPTRWLDLKSLMSSVLPLIAPAAKLECIHYFSALAHHRDADSPGNTARHKLYIEVLESTGVRVEMGRFKGKNVWCPSCKALRPAHEEKETDVAIACKLLELLTKNECDATVLVTGDTDLAPAVRTARSLFPTKPIYFAFPANRQNEELRKLVGPGRAFRLKPERYVKNQFPDPVVVGGRSISKPARW